MHVHLVFLGELHQPPREPALRPIEVLVALVAESGGHQIVHKEYTAAEPANSILEHGNDTVLVPSTSHPVVVQEKLSLPPTVDPVRDLLRRVVIQLPGHRVPLRLDMPGPGGLQHSPLLEAPGRQLPGVGADREALVDGV